MNEEVRKSMERQTVRLRILLERGGYHDIRRFGDQVRQATEALKRFRAAFDRSYKV